MSTCVDGGRQQVHGVGDRPDNVVVVAQHSIHAVPPLEFPVAAATPTPTRTRTSTSTNNTTTRNRRSSAAAVTIDEWRGDRAADTVLSTTHSDPMTSGVPLLTHDRRQDASVTRFHARSEASRAATPTAVARVFDLVVVFLVVLTATVDVVVDIIAVVFIVVVVLVVDILSAHRRASVPRHWADDAARTLSGRLSNCCLGHRDVGDRRWRR